MASFNHVTLLGRLTRDPELKFLSSGSPVCEFGFAVNRRYKSGDEWKEEACFVEITVWGKRGENCAEYLTKGREAFISGYLKMDSWEKDGQKRTKLSVTAKDVQFLGASENTKTAEDKEPHKVDYTEDLPF